MTSPIPLLLLFDASPPKVPGAQGVDGVLSLAAVHTTQARQQRTADRGRHRLAMVAHDGLDPIDAVSGRYASELAMEWLAWDDVDRHGFGVLTVAPSAPAPGTPGLTAVQGICAAVQALFATSSALTQPLHWTPQVYWDAAGGLAVAHGSLWDQNGAFAVMDHPMASPAHFVAVCHELEGVLADLGVGSAPLGVDQDIHAQARQEASLVDYMGRAEWDDAQRLCSAYAARLLETAVPALDDPTPRRPRM